VFPPHVFPSTNVFPSPTIGVTLMTQDRNIHLIRDFFLSERVLSSIRGVQRQVWKQEQDSVYICCKTFWNIELPLAERTVRFLCSPGRSFSFPSLCEICPEICSWCHFADTFHPAFLLLSPYQRSNERNEVQPSKGSGPIGWKKMRAVHHGVRFLRACSRWQIARLRRLSNTSYRSLQP